MIKKQFIQLMLLIVVMQGSSDILKAQLYGDFPYSQTFTSGSKPAEISLLTPQIGSNAVTFTTNGAQLTPSTNNSFGAIYLNNHQFSSVNGIHIEFEYGMYGGTGADGISMFLFDASIASPVVGAYGAGLGYGYNRANDSWASLRQTGLTGAFLGVGLDAFGNYKRSVFQGDQRSNGVPSSTFTQASSHVTLRGAKGNVINASTGLGNGYTGYPVLTTQSTLSGTIGAATINPLTGGYTTAAGLTDNFDLKTSALSFVPTDANYRKAIIELLPNILGGFDVTVKIQHGSVISNVINKYWYRTSYIYTENANPAVSDFNTSNTQGTNTTHTLNTTAPNFFRIGFAASTGGLNNTHIIKNLKVTMPYAAEAYDDTATGCRDVAIPINVLNNDLAYTGIFPTTVTSSSANIDKSSFIFYDASGNAVTGNTYTSTNGTWVYNPTTGIVTFTGNTGFVGTETAQYSIKGTTSPFNDEGYRSNKATISVTTTGGASCQIPFGCDSKLYLSQSNTLYEVSTASNPFTYPAIGSAYTSNYNSIALNPVDGFIYGTVDNTNTIVRIGKNGNYVSLGAVTGLPNGIIYNAGEIDPSGTYYVKQNTNNSTIYKINLSTMTATTLTLNTAVNTPDITYSNTTNLIYGINSANGNLVSINPTTGVVTNIGGGSGSTTQFGAMFSSSTGELFGALNTGGFYQFNLTNGARVLISSSPASNANDGAHCITAPIAFSADLFATKTDGKTKYIPGTSNTYTVVVGNNGPFGVLNASVTDLVPSGIPAANVSYTATVAGGATTSVTGTQTGAISDLVGLPVGGTVTYSVTVSIPFIYSGNLTNTVNITSPGNSTDTDTSNNQATDTDTSDVCYKTPVTSGTILDSNHGISALGRAGSNNGNWPMIRKGAWTVLEAKTKGLVINRLTTAQIAAIPTANLIEGMMVYNITQDCLQINTDGTAAGWKCFNNQSCPN